jgi:hypothetical protein
MKRGLYDPNMPWYGPDDQDTETLLLDDETAEKLRVHHLARAVEFQRTFAKHLPDLEDFKLANDEYEWFYECAVRHPPETLRRKKAKANFRKVAEALRVLSGYGLNDDALILPDERAGTFDPIERRENELIHIVDSLMEMRRQGFADKAIEKLIADSDALVDLTPETSNVNWPAVHAVDNLRWLWWRNTGKYPPSRALNPASGFRRFLRDGFDFLGLDSDVISAFKRWAAINKSGFGTGTSKILG